MESDLISRGRLLHTVLDHFGVDLAYLGKDLQFCQEAIQFTPAEKAIPFGVVKGYLLGLIDEWSKLGDRRYDQPNIQVYNHIRKELDDLEAYADKHFPDGDVHKQLRRKNNMEMCGDNRFEIIQKAKDDLLASTNIEGSPDEMKVLDSFLFRAWQMRWLNKYEPISMGVSNGTCKEMTFGMAIGAMKEGERVARKGWNGKDMYVFLAYEPDFVTDADISAFDQLEVEVGDMLVMKTAQNTFQPGWLASQADMLAEDWYIVED